MWFLMDGFKEKKYNIYESLDGKLHDGRVKYKKHTLDSDEDDSDDYEKDELCCSELDAEEEGVSKVRDEVKITPFNMREELEEGDFDKDGNYHWYKFNTIKDNWLDNIDWVKIEIEKDSKPEDANDKVGVKLSYNCNESLLYKQLLPYMMEGETVAGSLHRLGRNRVKTSSVQRLRLKKQGTIDDVGEKITKLTELANEILNKTGNMDIYQTSFECIQERIRGIPSTSKNCDMYSDDFSEKEKLNKETGLMPKELLWEFKWKINDTTVQGPFNSNQMLKWSTDGYFHGGVYVRKVGELTKFYRSDCIDFDIYL